jgi:phenylalanyl-tRNA synthetase beta chain
MMNTSFISSKLRPGTDNVRIANPLSNDLDRLRDSMLYNGVTSIAHNYAHRQLDLKFFEFGRTYLHNTDGKYKEEEHFSLWTCGNQLPPSWNVKKSESDFFYLKGIVQSIFEKIDAKENITEEPLTDNQELEYGIQLKSGNKQVVTLGKVPKSVTDLFGLPCNVYYADFNWVELLSCRSKGFKLKELINYPRVERDLALIIDKDVPFSKIKALSFQTEKKLLSEVVAFDVYEGKGIEEGKKSYAIRFTLQSKEKTLSDKEIEQVMTNLTEAFRKNAGAEVRTS